MAQPNRKQPKGTPIQRFWSYVEVTPTCWLWHGPLNSRGYGRLTIGRGTHTTAHRFFFQHYHMVTLREDIVVRHTCDNKRCVNVKHLVAGTQKQNVRDAVERALIGKLDLRKAEDIRRRFAAGGITQKELAAEYGVVQESISNIVTWKTWQTREAV